MASLLFCLPADARCAMSPRQEAGLPSAPTPGADNPDTLEQVRALVEHNKLPEAEAAARGSIAHNETFADAHYLLAYILLRENKPGPSLAEYTHASRLQPPSAEELKDVALDYVLASDYPDADKWMTTVTQWAPQDSDAWYSLGRIKYVENRFGDSIDCFQKALALSPRLVKAENNLGLALEGLNRPEQAIAAYRTAIDWQAGATDPSEQPLMNLGTILVDHNRNSEARPLLEQAEKIAPNDPKIRVELGRLYQRLGRLAEAQKELERAVEIDPKTAAYHFQLGQVYRRSGMIEKAKVEFAQAAAIDSSHSSK